MSNGIWDFFKELDCRRLPLGVIFPVALQLFHYSVTVRKLRGGKFSVKQQPEFKAWVGKRELDSHCLFEFHCLNRKFPALIMRFLQIKNDPYFIVSNSEALFRKFLSLVSKVNGRARESQWVRTFGMLNVYISRRKSQVFLERTEVIGLRLLALGDN